MKKKWKHSRLFYQYLLSYVFVLLVPMVILALFIYGYVLDILKEEIYNNNMAMLQTAKETIESSLQNITSPEHKVFLSDTLDGFKLQNDTIKAINTREELRQYRQINPFLRDIAYYQADDEYIVSSYSSSLAREFWDSMYLFENWSYEGFLAELEVNGGNSYFKESQMVLRNNNQYEIVTLVLPLNGKQNRCVIFMMDESFFVDLLPQNDLDNEVSAIVRDDGSIIAGRGNYGLIEEVHAMKLNSGEDVNEVTIRGKEYLCTRIYSEKYQWSYESLVLMSGIREKIVLVRWLMVLVCFLACMGGVVGIIYFMKRNYMPLQELEHATNKIMKNTDNQNEISHVKTVLEYLNRQNQKYQEEEELRGLALRGRFLSKWLSGHYENARQLEEQAHQVGIQLKKLMYQVAVIHTTQFPVGQEQAIEDALLGVAQAGIEVHLIVQTETEKILLITGFDQRRNTLVDTFYSDAINLLENDMELECCLGLGGIRTNSVELRGSYMEALKALDYRMILFEQKVIRYEEIMLREHVPVNVNPKELERYIKKRDVNGLEKFLNGACEELVQKRAHIRQVHMQCKDFLYALEKIIDEVNRDYFIDKPVYYDIIRVLRYDNFHELMENIYLIGCDIINQLNEISGRSVMEELIRYITENCYSADFATSIMAEEFKMSLPFLSQYFKKHMGRNLSDYVTELRISRAKELLRETDLPIKEVAESVGYISVNSFIRRFKQMIGCTPGDWRSGTCS